ncbi:MAG: hypothetical protein H7145_21020 [Akkermansiaceae bacterium]|nr:hypothetical protein [Armatimonadota bacterium]
MPNQPVPKYSLTVRDETVTGTATNERELTFLTEVITVRDLIRERVFAEVREYNAAPPGYFRGLVQPTDAEATLNGYRVRESKRQIDGEAQAKKALAAFEANGFLLLVDDKQVESPGEAVLLTGNTVVSFVKLVPLVGG